MPPGLDPSMNPSGFAPDFSLLELGLYAGMGLFGVLLLLTLLALATLPIFFLALMVLDFILRGFQASPDPVGKYAKLAGLVFRSLRRNLLRTALTYVALFVLTGMLTLIYSVVSFLGKLTSEKQAQQMVIVTEKFAIPSMMPPGYASQVKAAIQDKLPKQYQPADIDKNFMTWSFVGGSLSLEKRTQENSLFLFALDPDAVLNGMMSEQGLSKDDLGETDWNELVRVINIVKEDKRNIIVGEDRLQIMGKRVGDEMTLYGLNYPDITFECKIVGAFPASSRLGTGAAMRYDYLQAKLDEYRAQKGKDHSTANRCLNLIWVRLPDKESYERLAEIINDPASFSSPAVKMETFSAAIGSFLEAYKDIFWGMKYIIMPAIMVIMCLVIGITITIGVRERWTEMAVMKVLGFQPWQVMGMIVSEAVLIGVFGGMLSTWSVYFLPLAINSALKAAKVKFAFFDSFACPPEIIIYGPALGIMVGLLGAALPSWNARKVKVSDVFSQVA